MAKSKKVPGSKHKREAKPSETAAIEREQQGRQMAVALLVRRDGMDDDTAAMLVEGMDSADVEVLLADANTETMEQIPVSESRREVEPEPEPIAGEVTDFTEFEALAEDDELVGLAMEARDAGVRKREAELEYKAAKAQLWDKLIAAGVKVNQSVGIAGITFTPYIGKSSQLNKERLLELGVDPVIVKKGYKATPYNDVRITEGD